MTCSNGAKGGSVWKSATRSAALFNTLLILFESTQLDRIKLLFVSVCPRGEQPQGSPLLPPSVLDDVALASPERPFSMSESPPPVVTPSALVPAVALHSALDQLWASAVDRYRKEHDKDGATTKAYEAFRSCADRDAITQLADHYSKDFREFRGVGGKPKTVLSRLVKILLDFAYAGAGMAGVSPSVRVLAHDPSDFPGTTGCASRRAIHHRRRDRTSAGSLPLCRNTSAN